MKIAAARMGRSDLIGSRKSSSQSAVWSDVGGSVSSVSLVSGVPQFTPGLACGAFWVSDKLPERKLRVVAGRNWYKV